MGLGKMDACATTLPARQKSKFLLASWPNGEAGMCWSLRFAVNLANTEALSMLRIEDGDLLAKERKQE